MLRHPNTERDTTNISYGSFFLFPLDYGISYGIIFWGASPQSINIFKLHTHTQHI
jgi:hypothetical protein